MAHVMTIKPLPQSTFRSPSAAGQLYYYYHYYYTRIIEALKQNYEPLFAFSSQEHYLCRSTVYLRGMKRYVLLSSPLASNCICSCHQFYSICCTLQGEMVHVMTIKPLPQSTFRSPSAAEERQLVSVNQQTRQHCCMTILTDDQLQVLLPKHTQFLCTLC
jgi:hypothetical protein